MPLNIGFVGTGWVAGKHFDAFENIEDAQVVGCTDIDADRAARAAARHPGAGSYSELEAMLEDCEPDAVYVCVPPHAHGEIELALIERGIPFLVEKPLGNDRETPGRILRALEGKDLLTSVGYLFRYRDSVRRLREHLEEREAVIARGAWMCQVPPPRWWRRKEMSGGQVMEQTTHLVDLGRYLFGEVESVFCCGRRGVIRDVEDYDTDDATICSLSFEDGPLLELASSCATRMEDISLEVTTPDSRCKLSTWDLHLTMETPQVTQQFKSTEDVFLAEDRAFMEALRTGDASAVRSSYEDAFRTHMACCAANESLESGGPVSP